MLDKLCRACMASEDEDKLFEEFNEKDENFKQFIQLTSITIEKLKICENCQIELLNAIKFRSKCIDSDKRIRENYNIPTTPKFEVDTIEESGSTKKYVCEYCDKCFTRNYSLKRHFKVHIKEIPKISNQSGTDLDDNADEIDSDENLAEYKSGLTGGLTAKLESSGIEFLEYSGSENLLKNVKIEKIDFNDDSKDDEEFDYNDDPKDEDFVVEKEEEDNENEIEENEDKKNLLDCSEDIGIEKPNPKNKRRNLTSCPVCNKTFDRKYRLARHLNVHDPKKPYECDYDLCKIRFQTEHGLKRHKLSHILIDTPSTKKVNEFYQCPDCPRKFEKIESLSSHRRMHKKGLSEEKFECKICLKVFAKRHLLRRHSETHEENKHWKCELCNKSFALKSKFMEHNMISHQGLKPFTCTTCHKGFTQSYTLKEHMRIHSREKPFLCNECGKRFNNSSNLRQHVDRHKGIKRFVCNQCPSRFVDKGSLNSHMITHTGEKPYFCDICSSSFTKGYSLVKHKRIHTGERPFACPSCPMRFISSNHLKRHNRIHTGEKPYKCTFCERAFSQSNDLVKHLRSHVGEKVYQCKLCPSAFRLHFELRKHQQEHFKQNDESAVNDFQVINSLNAQLFLKAATDTEKC